MVVDELTGGAWLAVAHLFGHKRADHLTVAEVAALADIDVTTVNLEWAIRRRDGTGLGHRAVDEDGGQKLGDAANQDRQQR